MRYVLNVRKPQHLKQVTKKIITKKTELISFPTTQDFFTKSFIVLNGERLVNGLKAF